MRKSRFKLPVGLKDYLELPECFLLKQAVLDYHQFFEQKHKRGWHENKYAAEASFMWRRISSETYTSLNSILTDEYISRRQTLRILRMWQKLGIAKVYGVSGGTGQPVDYRVKRLAPVLPSVLYTFDRDVDDGGFIRITNRRKKIGTQPKYGYSRQKRAERLQRRGA